MTIKSSTYTPFTSVTEQLRNLPGYDARTTTTEVTPLSTDSKPQNSPARRDTSSNRNGFPQFARPQPELSPSDEVALYAQESGGSAPTSTTSTAQAVDEQGNNVEAQLITPRTQDASTIAQEPASAHTPTAHETATAVYAQNNEALFAPPARSQLAA